MTIFFQKLFFKNNRIKNDADRFHKSDRFKINRIKNDSDCFYKSDRFKKLSLFGI